MAESSAVAQKAGEGAKKARERSPSYPGITLQAALSRTKEFHDIEKRNPASIPVVAGHWGMKATSSSTLVTVAALKAFGLISDSGSGEKRRVQVTDLARRILLDERPDSEERRKAIKTAALNPRMHQILWKKWRNEIPSDANMRQTLIFDYKFNSNTVADFIKTYKETVRFANLEPSDQESQEAAPNDVEASAGLRGEAGLKIGDYVQWESGGQLQFREPKRVRGFSPDGAYLFVDGSKTGLPVLEVTVETPHSDPVSKSSMIREDVFSLPEGQVRVQWPTPLSVESVEDLKDWLKILDRKIARSVVPVEEKAE